MIQKANPSNDVWLRSCLGANFRLLAITDNDAQANEYTQQNSNAAVLATFGPLVLIADKRENFSGADDEAACQAAAESEGWSGPHTDRFGARYFEDVNDGQTWAAASWRELCEAFDIDT